MSFDFSTDKACKLIAQLIDKATKLVEYYSFHAQKGHRQVNFELLLDETKTGGQPGQIKMTEKKKELTIEE